ncbi:putative exported protein [Granulibacter bethesdensis CGDNIH4]|nr:putative exported protein [Granulibacter bethesdensis CGDNIH4]
MVERPSIPAQALFLSGLPHGGRSTRCHLSLEHRFHGQRRNNMRIQACILLAMALSMPDAANAQLGGPVNNFIPRSLLGKPSGVPQLGSDGRVPGSQVPRSVCAVITAGGTYTVPVWAVTLDIDAWGGGSSGGNGTVAASSTATSGGAGGSPGYHARMSGIRTASLGVSSLTVVVGAGGGQPSGAGAAGIGGGETNIIGGALNIRAGGGGAPAGGSTAASASGGSGSFLINGGPASGATAGQGYPFGIGGMTNGQSALNLTSPGVGASGGSGAPGAAGGGAGVTMASTAGAAAGGGVDSNGAGKAGGASGLTADSYPMGNISGGVAPGGNGGTIPARVQPGQESIGGAGGAGGNASTDGGNGSPGAGFGAPGGGGGSTITGRQYGLGAPGQSGGVVICARP